MQSSHNTTARETVLCFIEPDLIEPPTRRVSRRLRVVALVDERQHTERRFICRRPHRADQVVRRCPGVYTVRRAAGTALRSSAVQPSMHLPRCDAGHNRKTDALDAHSIAIVAVRTPGLRVLAPDGGLEALRMLTDCRDELARLRVQTVNRLQRLLSELIPGQRKPDLSALQAKAILATVRPRDIAGKTRRRMAAEELADLVAVDAKLKKTRS